MKPSAPNSEEWVDLAGQPTAIGRAPRHSEDLPSWVTGLHQAFPEIAQGLRPVVCCPWTPDQCACFACGALTAIVVQLAWLI